MSALLAPLEQPTAAPAGVERPALRVVPGSPLRLSRIGFIVFLTTLLGGGMVCILLLNTHIQQRAVEVSAAQRQAEDLGYRQASLIGKVEQLRSSSDLAERAWEMGLRPNPHPAFVKLGADGTSGQLIGEPVPVTGKEMPNQRPVGADDVTVQITKRRAAYQAEQARRAAAAKAAAEKARQERIAAEKAAAAKQKAERLAAKQRSEAAAAKAKAAQSQNSAGGH